MYLNFCLSIPASAAEGLLYASHALVQRGLSISSACFCLRWMMPQVAAIAVGQSWQHTCVGPVGCEGVPQDI